MLIDGKGDAVENAEANMDTVERCSNRVRFSGVRDHGMHDNVRTRQPGRPRACFHGWERAPTTEIREAEFIACGESDRLIVPTKAGNSAGGKEATYGRAK